jgi:hypothetical protein
LVVTAPLVIVIFAANDILALLIVVACANILVLNDAEFATIDAANEEEAPDKALERVFEVLLMLTAIELETV